MHTLTSRAELPRSFVSRLVAVAMSAGEDVSKSLAIGTLRQLLPRGVVSDSDVADGLALTALRRHDWVRGTRRISAADTRRRSSISSSSTSMTFPRARSPTSYARRRVHAPA